MTPSATHQNHAVGIVLFLEVHSRVFSRGFGKLPQPLRDDCWQQPDYCLDAPARLPAGGCFSEQVGRHDWVVSQVLTERES